MALIVSDCTSYRRGGWQALGVPLKRTRRNGSLVGPAKNCQPNYSLRRMLLAVEPALVGKIRKVLAIIFSECGTRTVRETSAERRVWLRSIRPRVDMHKGVGLPINRGLIAFAVLRNLLLRAARHVQVSLVLVVLDRPRQSAPCASNTPRTVTLDEWRSPSSTGYIVPFVLLTSLQG